MSEWGDASNGNFFEVEQQQSPSSDNLLGSANANANAITTKLISTAKHRNNNNNNNNNNYRSKDGDKKKTKIKRPEKEDHINVVKEEVENEEENVEEVAQLGSNCEDVAITTPHTTGSSSHHKIRKMKTRRGKKEVDTPSIGNSSSSSGKAPRGNNGQYNEPSSVMSSNAFHHNKDKKAHLSHLSSNKQRFDSVASQQQQQQQQQPQQSHHGSAVSGDSSSSSSGSGSGSGHGKRESTTQGSSTATPPLIYNHEMMHHQQQLHPFYVYYPQATVPNNASSYSNSGDSSATSNSQQQEYALYDNTEMHAYPYPPMFMDPSLFYHLTFQQQQQQHQQVPWYAPLDSRLTDCSFFMDGKCSKKETCKYRHCVVARDYKNPSVCKYWKTAMCRNVECKFRHPKPIFELKSNAIKSEEINADGSRQSSTGASNNVQDEQQIKHQEMKKPNTRKQPARPTYNPKYNTDTSLDNSTTRSRNTIRRSDRRHKEENSP